MGCGGWLWCCSRGLAEAVFNLGKAPLPFQRGPKKSPRHLACIAHKSLEICERCRLWQRNPPATPEHSTAFLKRNLYSSS
jgi:hypothetical protein